MTEPHHTEPSIATRMKWIADFRAKYPEQKVSLFYSVTGFEGVIDQTYNLSEMSRIQIIELVLQCRVAGLDSKANELEQSLGECDKEELKKMYSQIN